MPFNMQATTKLLQLRQGTLLLADTRFSPRQAYTACCNVLKWMPSSGPQSDSINPER
jgi:hypothetical protein